jgi:hypothetical protein
VERSITVVVNGCRIEDQAIIHIARRNARGGIRTGSTNIAFPPIKFASGQVAF